MKGAERFRRQKEARAAYSFDERCTSFNRRSVDPLRIGRFWATRRKELGLSQQQLGDLVGMARNHVGRLENGNVMPGLATIERMCTALRIRVTDMFAVNESELP